MQQAVIAEPSQTLFINELEQIFNVYTSVIHAKLMEDSDVPKEAILKIKELMKIMPRSGRHYTLIHRQLIDDQQFEDL